MNKRIKHISDKLGTFDKEPLDEFPTYEESGWPEIFEDLEELNNENHNFFTQLLDLLDDTFGYF